MTFFKRGPSSLNPPDLAEATRLTRSGDLAAATAAIQQQLMSRNVRDALGDTGVATTSAALSAQPRRLALGATLRKIAAGGMPQRAVPAIPAQPLPAGATFTTRSYRGPQGSRDYMVYLPSCSAPRADPLPLVIMLHGCTQSPADFARGTGMNDLAEAEAVIVAYPMQTSAANMSKCWNWFRPTDQVRDQGEPAILAGIARDLIEAGNVDPSRIYVAGLSAGGAAALIVAQAYPDLFAAVGVHSGLPLGAASDVPSAFGAMRTGAAGRAPDHAIPTIVFHGTADQAVNVSNGHAVAAQAQSGFKGQVARTRGRAYSGRTYDRVAVLMDDGRSACELWLVAGAPHAWSGGNPAGSYTDPTGPDASAEMLRFFRQHRLG